MEREASSASSTKPERTSTSDPTLDPSPSSSVQSPQAEEKKCAYCKTPALPTNPDADDEDEAEEKGLKPCSKCHTALYCSRDCAKAGWKVHKKTCAADAQKYALGVEEKPATRRVPKKEGHRGGLQKWQFDT